jgi:hypothetical protein
VAAAKPGTAVQTTVTIHPRGKLDLPAYTLKDYQLVWEVKDQAGKALESGFTNLPVIRPGAQSFTQQVNWTMPAQNPSQVTFTLLSPLNYPVYDTTIYLQKPAAPKIRSVITGESGVRIVFDKDAATQYYKVNYGKGDFTASSDTTINHYIDITKLEKGQSYQFQVVGINPIGEGTPAETIRTPICCRQ